MEQIAAFLDMGGYAGFVWPAFAVAAIVMVGLLVHTLRTLKARAAMLAVLEAETGRGARRRHGHDRR